MRRYTIQVLVKDGYAGGYLWSLNPESAYGYNPFKTTGVFMEGLVDLKWLTANKELLKAMEHLDELNHLKPLVCRPNK